MGASFQYMDYIESISDDKDETNELYRKIYLTGEVNTSQAGNYEISYYVTDSDKNQSNIVKINCKRFMNNEMDSRRIHCICIMRVRECLERAGG